MGDKGDSDQTEGGRTKKEKLLKNIAIDPILRFNNHLRLPLHIDHPALANEIADAYTSEREETVEPFPGAIDTLHYLKDQGICLALITNGNAEGQRRKVDKFGLGSIFDYILIEGEFGVGKPDEQVCFRKKNNARGKP